MASRVYFAPSKFSIVKFGLWDIFTTVLVYQCNISNKVQSFSVSSTHWRICVILSLTTFFTQPGLVFYNNNNNNEKGSGIPWIAIEKSQTSIMRKTSCKQQSDTGQEWQREREREQKKDKKTDREYTEKRRHLMQSWKQCAFCTTVETESFFIFFLAATCTKFTCVVCCFSK